MELPYERTIPRLGFGFRNGKLYHFQCGHGATVIHPWGPTRCWQSSEDFKVWRSAVPDLFSTYCKNYFHPPKGKRLKKGQEIKDRNPLLTAFFSAIPEEQRQMLGRLHLNQWQMLLLLDRCGSPGLELARNNPFLALLLASARYLGVWKTGHFYRAIRSRLCKRQHEQLEWLGFPGTASAVKICRKIDTSLIRHRYQFWQLRACMQNPESMKCLAHLPRINWGAIKILSEPDLLSVITPSLIIEAGFDEKNDRSPVTYGSLITCIALANRQAVRLPRFRSLEQLYKWEERYEDHSYITHRADYLRRTLPEPPLTGYMDEFIRIEPLCTPQMLKEEGEEQRNCVFSCIDDITGARGGYYLYRFEGQGTRATFSISRVNDAFVLGDIKGSANSEVSTAVRNRVIEWLEDSQGIEHQLSLPIDIQTAKPVSTRQLVWHNEQGGIELAF